MTYINPCPGLCVDASGGANSISSGHLNEFYLNSHVAIQGTAKPCKYTLVHDEIGFKISELELMTYWLTYLYCRANKSVSYASPAYYAHWASKRGKSLCAAGGSPADLLQISQKWGEANMPSPMFFI
jgi:Piwi domain